MALQGIGGELELLPAKTGVVNIQNNIFIPSLSPSLYTVKKVNDFPVLSRDVTYTKLSLGRNN
jgi:hypothetical protein